jgi:hypothetical protein
MLTRVSASFPYAASTVSTVSVAALLTLQQNFIATLCSLLYDNMVLLRNIKQKCTLELLCSRRRNFAQKQLRDDGNEFQQWPLDNTSNIL